jgi:hypothetical protein
MTLRYKGTVPVVECNNLTNPYNFRIKSELVESKPKTMQVIIKKKASQVNFNKFIISESPEKFVFKDQ